MTAAAFQRRHQDAWNALARLTERLAAGGPGALAPAEVVELARLYRQATSDLAKARTVGLPEAPLRWLNELCARARGVIYVGPRLRARTVRGFVLGRLPALLRAHAGPVALAAGLFAAAGALGFAAAARDPSLARVLAPAGGAELTSGGFAVLALRAVLGGLALGVGALVALALGGAAAGATVALAPDAGALLGAVAPHAPLALLGAAVAGAAALRTGWRLVAPGAAPRREAVAVAAADGAVLLLVAAAMLAGALALELLVSTRALPTGLKAAAGALGLLAPLVYAGVGRRSHA
ncbi:MAG TPA: stage II sporulation protein M [Polyangia bacterium]|jgi:hypothetical protein